MKPFPPFMNPLSQTNTQALKSQSAAITRNLNLSTGRLSSPPNLRHRDWSSEIGEKERERESVYGTATVGPKPNGIVVLPDVTRFVLFPYTLTMSSFAAGHVNFYAEVQSKAAQIDEPFNAVPLSWLIFEKGRPGTVELADF